MFGFLVYYPDRAVEVYLRPEGLSLISQPHETASDKFCFETDKWYDLEFSTYNCGENVIVYIDGQQVMDVPVNPKTSPQNYLSIYTNGIGAEDAYLMIMGRS